MTKMHMANWTKMTVVIGGEGDITLGDVTGFPNISETLGTGKSFYYAFLNINLSPIEVGYGIMLDAITLQRDVIEAAMIDGVYTADGVTPADIPVGAIMFTAPTKGMLDDLMLEMSLRDYGNVTGAVSMSCQYKALKFNCTGNTTLTLNELPPVGTKAEIELHITSANHPTNSPVTGFNLTLAGATYISNNAALPSVQLLPSAETCLRLITIDGGTTFYVENISKKNIVKDLGDLTGTINLDIRYPNNKAILSDASTVLIIDDVSPDVPFGEEAHFSFLNTSGTFKTINFNSAKFIPNGTILTLLQVPPLSKAEFTVRRSAHTTDVYDYFVNGINFNVTGSGLATNWNPSAYDTTKLTLASSNTLLSHTGAVNATNEASVGFMFGVKSSGEYYLSVINTGTWSGSSTNIALFNFGISSSPALLTDFPSDFSTGFGLLVTDNTSSATIPHQKENAGTATTMQSLADPALGTVFTIEVDFDYATNTGGIWYKRDLTYLGNNSTTKPASPDQTFPTAGNTTQYFAYVALAKWNANGGNVGTWRVLNEVEANAYSDLPTYWLI